MVRFVSYPFPVNRLLPTVVRESLVRFRHAVHVFFLLHCSAASVCGVHNFFRQLFRHGLARARPQIKHQPVNRQRLPPERIHFHRNLVVRAAHASRLHFQRRLAVLNGLLEQLERVVIRLLRHLVHGVVENRLRRRALAVVHHARNKLLHQVAVIHRIARNLTPKNPTFAWHLFLLPLTSLRLWAASRRISSAPACDFPLPRRPAFRESRDSARPADPSRGRRAPVRSNALEDCGRSRECKSSLPRCSSAARAPLSAARNLASSASACRRERTRRAFPDSLPAPGTSSSSEFARARGAPTVKTSALCPLDFQRLFAIRDTSPQASRRPFFRAAQTIPRRVLRVHEQKRSPNLKELPGTPLRRFTPRSELHLLLLRRGSHGFAGLAPHFGRSSLAPIRPSLFRGRKTSLSPPCPKASIQPQEYRHNNKTCQPDTSVEIGAQSLSPLRHPACREG